MPNKYDIGLVSNDQTIIARCKTIGDTYGYSCNPLPRDYDFVKNEVEFRLLIVGGADFPNGGEFSAFIKLMRRGQTETFILFIENEKSVENSSEIAKTFGAVLALTDREFFDTSKGDYIFSQVIRATFLP